MGEHTEIRLGNMAQSPRNQALEKPKQRRGIFTKMPEKKRIRSSLSLLSREIDPAQQKMVQQKMHQDDKSAQTMLKTYFEQNKEEDNPEKLLRDLNGTEKNYEVTHMKIEKEKVEFFIGETQWEGVFRVGDN